MKTTLIRARATDSAIYKVAESLSQNGHDVTLLVWDKQNILKDKVFNNYKLKRFVFKAPEDTWKVYFYFPIWSLYELLFLLKDGSDIIHASDLDTLLPAIIAKCIKRKKLFYTIYDFYANNLTINNKFMLVFKNLLASLEKWGIGFTDALFLVDECRFSEVEGAKIKNLSYIYNSPPDYYNNAHPGSNSTDGYLKIFYTGMIIKNRGISYLIKAIEDLDNIKLKIGGIGPGVDLLKNMNDKINKKVEYIGWVPSYDEVIKLSLDADVLFRFNDPIVPKSKFESPNKLFEAMMCAKPIIVNSEIAASNIVKSEDCGICVPYGDIDAIKKAIVKLQTDKEFRHNLGDNGRKAYETKYSWKIMEKRLLDTYVKAGSG